MNGVAGPILNAPFERRLALRRVTILFGAYGSGKSEIALNLATRLRQGGYDTALVDADFYKPLFRSGQFRGSMQRRGIRVILPPGELAGADMAALPSDIYGVLEGGPNVVFDVGGEQGARVLGAMAGRFRPGTYEAFLVVNTRRPGADTAEGIASTAGRVQAAARLPVTGLVANTNLGEASTVEVAIEGYKLVSEAGRRLTLPVAFAALDERLVDRLSRDDFPVPVLTVRRFLLPPWEQEDE
ncbi:MAG TPA: hypothetical protein VGL40_14835 [Bacillota bacterium]